MAEPADAPEKSAHETSATILNATILAQRRLRRPVDLDMIRAAAAALDRLRRARERRELAETERRAAERRVSDLKRAARRSRRRPAA
jgi:hypothetical protein